jgi:hypothetical protein
VPSSIAVASKLGSPTESPSSGGAEIIDLASALAAADHGRSEDELQRGKRANRRAALTLVLIALLIAGVIDVATPTNRTRTPPNGVTRADVVFNNAQSGACLNWPPDAPDEPSFVQCRDDHMFEVAKPVGMNTFGDPCQLAVRQYLGNRYDPNSRFTISVLWAGDAVGAPPGQRNLLCGLQLLGPGGRPTPFKGQIADLDQSKVWPAGTCLGFDEATKRSTDVPVDCSAPHAVEVVGALNLAERFGEAVPPEPDQQAFGRDACTQAAEAYLAPATLQTKGLELSYDVVSPASWSAGSRQMSCGVGTRRDNDWTAMVGSVKGQPVADVAPPQSLPPPPPEQPPPPIAPAIIETPPPAPEVRQAPPVAPPPVAPPPAAPPTTAPTTAAAPATPQGPTTTTTVSNPPATAPGPPPAAGAVVPPPPGAPAAPPPPPPTTEQTPVSQVLEIPGLAPITLPWPAPAEAPPPAA